ncbi:hypothetical protein GC089_14255 [Cellulomonas sp. JZ18]|uniref:DUF6492 family protein n=1 Tax=Cellulomonas sp. JZ18 TaxID=2654191 RepID=UPI0012D4016A|nr:DUF6492 family protein [Cellulomonas sp. JZ18]QGQ20155.1 hypothetical protein GC089_14255 [Cellulomonas sp. JZ18]
MALTWVTPVFEAEVPLLHLQARSLARHVPAHDVADVVVLDNTARGLRQRDRAALLDAYGAHAARVRLLRPTDVCPVPRASGWRRQQALKLAVARSVATAHYVVLDAKNHLVAPPAATAFVTADGRARVRGYGYRDHPLRPAFTHVLTHLGLDPDAHVDRFAATVTPFVLDTAVVRALLHEVEQESGRPFAHAFVAADLTEFFLYAGWVARRDGTLARVMELTDEPSATVWPRAATADGVRATLATVASHDLPVLGVHRNAVPRLDPAARRALATFWAERDLVDSAADGVALLERMARRHAVERRRQQVRDVVPRALALARRARTARRGAAA